MSFIEPGYLLLLLLLPLVIVFLLWRNQVKQRVLSRIGTPEVVAQLVASTHPQRRILQTVLWFVVVTALIFAAARPTFGTSTEVIDASGVQVVFVLDVSRSMDAEDVLPSRLQRAVFDIQAIAQTIEGNDIAVVLFAADAITYVPMTYDSQLINSFLDVVSTDSLSHQGTNLSAAIERAELSFSGDDNSAKIMVLMTDGEDQEGNILELADNLTEADTTLYIVGYGTADGGLIPIHDEDGNLIDYKMDAFGSIVETHLNADLLSRFAEAANGAYLEVGRGDDVSQLTDAILAMTPGQLGPRVISRPLEQGFVFAGIALLALSLELLLPALGRIFR
ncbi:MAG: VWA domain-containing protein [Anaerolineaceae bacterium]|nr:VWA domain-containing protein [Anaerolineaceae bacterium]